MKDQRRQGQTDRRSDSIHNQIDRAIFDALLQAKHGHVKELAKTLCAKIADLQAETAPSEQDEDERDTAHDDHVNEEVAEINKRGRN